MAVKKKTTTKRTLNRSAAKTKGVSMATHTTKRRTTTAATTAATTTTKPSTYNTPRKTYTSSVNENKRREMISVAAYFKAKNRGFCNGNEWADWFAAEKEVDQILKRTTH